VVLGWLMALSLSGRALGQSDYDPVQDKLNAAKAAHAQAINSAVATMSAAFDAQIKSLTAAGDADNAKVLAGQKAAFIATGALPTSPLMGPAIGQLLQSTKEANDALVDAYNKAITGFNQEPRADLATKARQERDALMTPVVAGGVGTQTPANAILPPEYIAQQLEAAKAQHRQDIDAAKGALLKTIDARINAATDAGDLAGVQALQSVQATASVDGTVPADVKDVGVAQGKKTYDAAVLSADTKLRLAYEKAVRDYTRARQLADAQSTQKELDALGLVDSTSPTAMTAGTYQLGSKLPAFLTAKDSVFVPLGDRLGVVVPQTNFIRTKESDLLEKNFTFDAWFYMVQGMAGFAKLPPAVVGFGDGELNPVNGGPMDSLYLEINPPDQNGGAVNLHRREMNTKTTIGHITEFDTYVVRIEKFGDSVTLIVGTEQSGTLVPQASVTIGDVRSDCPFLNDFNGRLFIGSGGFKQLAIGKGPAKVTAVAGAAPLVLGTKPAASKGDEKPAKTTVGSGGAVSPALTPVTTAPMVKVKFASGATELVEVRDGAKCFSNRDYVLAKVPPELEGATFTRRSSGEGKSVNVNIDATAGTTVYLMVNVETDAKSGGSADLDRRLLAAGWVRIGDSQYGGKYGLAVYKQDCVTAKQLSLDGTSAFSGFIIAAKNLSLQ
jgi:hypothetical protein